MCAGTLQLLRPEIATDRIYAYVMAVPLVLYCVTSTAVYLGRDPTTRRTRPVLRVSPHQAGLATWITLLAAAIVGLLYFVAVGYNVFLLGLKGLVTSQTQDYTSLRLGAYSPDRYLYPGYVNQFKNILFPALAVVVVYGLYRNRVPFRGPVSIVLVLVSVVDLLGTGQRGAFVLFALVVVTFIYWENRKRFLRRVAVVAVATGALMVVATIILGRGAAEISTRNSIWGKLWTVLGEVWARLWTNNQESGERAFSYTHALPTQNGHEWLQGILGILPGNSGSPLGRELFYQAYGSERGSAPASLWGSVHYNFGFIGLIVVPVVLAILFQSITGRLLRRPEVTSLEMIGVAGVFVVLGDWVAGGPEYILNAGGVTFAIILLLGRRSTKGGDPRDRQENRDPTPSASATRSSVLVGHDS
jgi:oligosaccharide repeat unit polymerase